MRDKGGRFNFHETAAGQYRRPPGLKSLLSKNAPPPRFCETCIGEDGRKSKLPFRQRNKKLVAERTHKSGNAARGRLTPAGPFLDWVSPNQSYRPATLYSVKGVHDVVPVEYGQEIFHRSGSVARSGLNIFPQDASSVLNGTN